MTKHRTQKYSIHRYFYKLNSQTYSIKRTEKKIWWKKINEQKIEETKKFCFTEVNFNLSCFPGLNLRKKKQKMLLHDVKTNSKILKAFKKIKKMLCVLKKSSRNSKSRILGFNYIYIIYV